MLVSSRSGLRGQLARERDLGLNMDDIQVSIGRVAKERGDDGGHERHKPRGGDKTVPRAQPGGGPRLFFGAQNFGLGKFLRGFYSR